MKKLLRKIYKKILKKLTIYTLKKHKPNIIAVMGDGHTSIARELIYQVINTKYAARRNIESQDVEFNLPLTILGFKRYPQKIWEWLWLVIKSGLENVYIKPYSHILILELNFTKADILDEWLKIIKPETAFIVGSMPIDYSEYGFRKVIKISNNGAEEILGPYKIALGQLTKLFDIKEEFIDEIVQKFNLPETKIRILPGLNNSTIIDATHHYYPSNLEAALELVPEESTNNIIYTKMKPDLSVLKNIKYNNWIINPDKYAPKENDIILIRGNRLNILNDFPNIFENKINE